MKNALIMACVMTMILLSCHKDSSFEEFNETVTTGDVVIDISTIKGEVSGIVYDESNQAVSNVTISINGYQEQTDQNGIFYFPNAQLNERGTYIKAEKDGYILGSDFIYPEAGLNTSYIQMMQLSQDISFQADAGGTVPIERGGSIEFNPDAITSALGGTYTGKVNVTAKRLATDDPRLEDKMPGDLVGRNASNHEVVLATLGMVAVELRGENGEELNLREGSMARITFPIAEQDQAFAPDQIPLWYFDEDKGLWIEEGNATKVGNNYVGEVAHFSFWNCDAPFELINLCVSIVNENGTPADDVKVKICTNGLGTRSGRPQRGILRGKVPKNEVLEFKVFENSDCGELLYQQEIGPFTEDVKLDPIVLQDGSKFLLTGNVLCNGVTVTNAQLVIQGNNFIDLVQANENGQFSYSTCSNDIIHIYARDLDTGEGSVTQEVIFTETSPELDLTFETCVGSDCAFEVDVTTANVLPCDEQVEAAAVITGDGNYTYSWSNGATGQTIQISQGEYTVTVSEDGTDCEKIFAFTAPGDFTYLELGFDFQEVDCSTGLGSITANVVNGAEPYTYAWTDESGQSLGTNESLSDIAPGTYSILVTDAAGCSISTLVNLNPGLLDIGNVQLNYILTCASPVATAVIDDQNGLLTVLWTGPNGLVSTQAITELWTPGEYQLEITDPNGCQEVFTVLVIEDVSIPNVEAEILCDGFSRDIVANSFKGQSIGEIYTPDGNILTSDGNGNFSYSLLDYEPGSMFTVVVVDASNGCTGETLIIDEFSSQNSIEIVSSREASCSTCADGQIEANIIDPTNCVGCEIEIYTENNGTLLSVTLVNDLGQLGSGPHYVSLKDETGCITEFLTVEL